MIERINNDKPESIVFFNPMGTDLCFWKKKTPSYFINNYEVIFINYPGYNCLMETVDSFRDLADYYHEELLSQLEKPFHLVGYSYGGLLIQHILQREYAYVKSVSLIACSHKLSARDKENIYVLNEINAYNRFLFAKTLALLSYGPKAWAINPLLPIQIYANIKTTMKDHLPISQQLKHILDLKDITFPKVSVKALIIYGDQDQLMHAESLRAIEDLFESIKLIKLKNQYHMIDIDLIYKYLIKFIKTS